MSVTHVVVPLNPSLHDYLDAEGAAYPSEVGRRPSLLEVRAAIAVVPNVTAVFDVPLPGGTWTATLETAPSQPSHAWAVITAHPFNDEASGYDIAFERGSPELIVSVLHALSSITGPLVLVPDSGEAPLVVSQQQTVPALLSSWADADADGADDPDDNDPASVT